MFDLFAVALLRHSAQDPSALSCRLLGLLQVFPVAALILISVLLSLLLHPFLPSSSPALIIALSVSAPELEKIRNLIQANVS